MKTKNKTETEMKMKAKQLKETYINTLVNSMSMEDLQQYVVNDMADFLYNCNEIGVIQNEFLIKIEHTLDEQFYNKFVKQSEGKIKWVEDS